MYCVWSCKKRNMKITKILQKQADDLGKLIETEPYELLREVFYQKDESTPLSEARELRKIMIKR